MLLLDSHVVMWWLLEPERLSAAAIESITSAQDRAYVSSASIWELEMKRFAGRLDVPGGIADHAAEEGFTPLPIAARHATRAAQLPTHHKDPFDRMLVAQAQLEHLTLVTADRQIAAYDVTVLAP
ncbi:MAG: Ribonuclease VapC22 [Thermoleophilia bacterium]|nr:Ribonuclease VapC22 [Thermoleophilia bacterium]